MSQRVSESANKPRNEFLGCYPKPTEVGWDDILRPDLTGFREIFCVKVSVRLQVYLSWKMPAKTCQVLDCIGRVSHQRILQEEAK